MSAFSWTLGLTFPSSGVLFPPLPPYPCSVSAVPLTCCYLKVAAAPSQPVTQFEFAAQDLLMVLLLPDAPPTRLTIPSEKGQALWLASVSPKLTPGANTYDE